MIQVMGEQLKQAWGRLRSIPTIKSPREDYACVEIEASGSHIKMSVQNQYAYGMSRCIATVDTPMRVFLKAEQLSKIVDNADGMVNIRPNENMLTFTCGRWESNAPLVVATLYRPEMPENLPVFVTTLAGFRRAMSAAHATNARGNNYEMIAIDLSNRDEPMIVATNGAEAAIAKLPAKREDWQPSGAAKVPHESAGIMLSFWGRDEGIVRLVHSHSQVMTYNSDAVLYTVQAEGRIMPYATFRSYLSCRRMLNTHRGDLLKAVGVCGASIDTADPGGLSIRMTALDTDLTLESRSRNYGRTRTVASYTSESDESFECLISASRLRKAIGLFDTEILRFGLTDNDQSLLFSDDQLTWVLACMEEASNE